MNPRLGTYPESGPKMTKFVQQHEVILHHSHVAHVVRHVAHAKKF